MSVKKRVKAIDRFIAGCKTDGIYDDLNAACIMAGWDGLAGALTPLKGTAPTNTGFLDADLDRGIGLTGDGSTKYLDSNRASEEDDQDSHHLAVFQTNPQIGNPKYIAGRGIVDAGTTTLVGVSSATNKLYTRSRNSADNGGAAGLSATGLLGMSRSASDNYDVRVNSNTFNTVQDSQTPLTGNIWVFRSNNVGSGSSYDGTLSFYSIGSATDLALLDARVSTLMADLRAIEERDFDTDALAYIRAVEAADGAYLETGVKVAYNKFFKALKKDSLFDAIKASCILAGARTLAGALVPVVGDAPTNVADGFVEGDYSRTSGLTGDGTSYIDSGRAQNADGSSNQHCSVFLTDTDSGQNGTYIGVRDAANVGTQIVRDTDLYFTSYGGLHNQGPSTPVAGFYGVSRSLTTSFQYRYDGTSAEKSANAQAGSTNNFYIFSRPYNPLVSSATCSFYSIGSAVDLEALDTAVSNLISDIGAAL